MSMTVKRFERTDIHVWNQFVAASRNGTFLFDRDYMDYHADRFEDASLMISDAHGLLALLPANRRGDSLVSHGGLTYGGVIFGDRMTTSLMLDVFAALQTYCSGIGIRSVLYKTMPSIYCRYPSEEDRYALFRANAQLVRRDVLAVVPRNDRLAFQERRRRGASKARKAGIVVLQENAFAEFWNVLESNLRQRYGVAPVHSLAEIELLHGRFPESIRLYCARLQEDVLAGIVVYETPLVAHVQYISAGERGRELHALDAVFDHVLNVEYAAKAYFDFGISNENDGKYLNVGLMEQKEGFGARAVAHDYYELILA